MVDSVYQPPNLSGPGWVHYCERPGCDKWGAFGHAMGSRIEWFCKEHDPCDGHGSRSPKWRALQRPEAAPPPTSPRLRL
jgi:hypothetical protein